MITGKYRLVIFLVGVVLAGSAYADLQNVGVTVPNSTMKNYDTTVIPASSGFVQFIKGSPSNPPTAKANTTTPAFSAGDTYAIFKDPANPALLGKDIKGTVGDFPGYSAGAGGFAFKNQLDHPVSTNYYLRYWTADGNYYGNSPAQSFWTSGNPVPNDLSFSSFTLYRAAAPYKPAINSIKQIESTQKDLHPVGVEVKVSQISFSFSDGTTGGLGNVQVKGDGTSKPYILQINKGDPNFGTKPPYGIELDGTSYTLDKTNDPNKAFFSDTTATYYARAVAVNYFGTTAGDAVPFQVVVLGGQTTGAAGELMILNLVKTADLGVNQFEFTLDPTKTIFYTQQGETLTSTEMTNKTVKGLVDAINTFSGGAAVKSIGWWNNNVNNTQRMEGYTIAGGVWTGSTGTAGNGTETLKNIVYQVSVSPSVVNFKMTRETGK
ncbi:MAG: hypothetical protein WCW67_04660 [Candidatus Margulisiibacteriota bacterium]